MGETASLVAATCGAACGLVAALPSATALRRARRTAPGAGVGLARGIASVLAAFALLQGAMLVAWRLRPASVAPFGVTAALAFLATVLAAALAPRR